MWSRKSIAHCVSGAGTGPFQITKPAGGGGLAGQDTYPEYYHRFLRLRFRFFLGGAGVGWILLSA